ncbi:hypothetical protein KR222_007291 [Zaprionus bogoriensis]|nr:hypothetical protein KR222_007291 [Zaprionus bogoriensis]
MGRTQRRRQRRAATRESAPGAARDTLHALYAQLHALGWRNETQLSARQFPQTGRGLCSKLRAFGAGDELIRLPSNCLISLATLESDVQFKRLFERQRFDKDARISFQALVACYLLQQQHLHLHDTTPWSAYLETLPRGYTTPYFCTRAELQCLPDALLERTVAQNRQIRDSFQLIQQLTRGLHCACCGQRCECIWQLEDYKRCYFAVNTRSVYLDARQLQLPALNERHFGALLSGDANLALAPFLDLFNHSDRVQTTAQLQRSDYVLTLNSTAAGAELRPYEQLYISYGSLPNLRLLSEYGFYVAHNAHDYFEFSMQDIEQLIAREKSLAAQSYHRNIFKFIREHNLADQMFVHLEDGCSHNLRVVLHLIFKQQAHFPNILNQIAFGDAAQFSVVEPQLGQLVAHKISEYRGYAKALAQLPELTPSAAMARDYLLECVRYLHEYAARH